jgi:NADP-dependent 3-hydroxy acid dehydrogenase YdfG
MTPEPVYAVVGASAGVGAAVVRRLTTTATRIYAASRRGVAPVAHPSVVGVRCDVQSYDDVRRLLDRPVDYLVNCAGVGFYAPLDGPYTAEWTEMVLTNVVGLANLLAVAATADPPLKGIVHIGSLASHRMSHVPGNVVYSVTKMSARLLVEDYRRQTRAAGRDTRVMSISPGFIEGTEFGDHFFRGAPELAVDLYAAHRALTAADVAELIDWMLALPPHVEVTDLITRPRQQPD